VTYHFAESNGTSTYGIGVKNSDPNVPVLVNKPMMGAFVNYQFVTVYDSKGTFKPYVYAYSTGADQSFLNSENAKVVKSIFRTLVINT
jgi:hypothetical protein